MILKKKESPLNMNRLIIFIILLTAICSQVHACEINNKDAIKKIAKYSISNIEIKKIAKSSNAKRIANFEKIKYPITVDSSCLIFQGKKYYIFKARCIGAEQNYKSLSDIVITTGNNDYEFIYAITENCTIYFLNGNAVDDYDMMIQKNCESLTSDSQALDYAKIILAANGYTENEYKCFLPKIDQAKDDFVQKYPSVLTKNGRKFLFVCYVESLNKNFRNRIERIEIEIDKSLSYKITKYILNNSTK
jgi:hypothetical protein